MKMKKCLLVKFLYSYFLCFASKKGYQKEFNFIGNFLMFRYLIAFYSAFSFGNPSMKAVTYSFK